MFYLTIVNNILRHCHSWLVRKIKPLVPGTLNLPDSTVAILFFHDKARVIYKNDYICNMLISQ